MTRLIPFCLLGLFILFSACGQSDIPHDSSRSIQGYAEGRLIYLAPRTLGPITTLSVEEGDPVEKNDMLFSLDDGTATSALAQAQATHAALEARLADLQAGGRQQDIDAARQSVARANAALKLAKGNQARSAALVAKGQAPQSRLDQDDAVLAQAQAELGMQKAQLALVRAPARKDAISGAADDVRAQQAVMAQAAKALANLSVWAPTDGVIEMVLRRRGEIAGPSQPVLALLAPEQLRIRFFIAETDLALLQTGDRVQLSCDSCKALQEGRIVFIANSAEFTPPIIFTEKERKKLVYMVEARPETPSRFHPGQPVMVTLQ